MRMFQSSTRHSSEQSTAHNSSRPTASQLKGVSDTISNWFENHRPQRTQISTVTNAPFHSNLNRMASRLTAIASFPSVFFNSWNIQGNIDPSFSAHWADLMTKTDSTFPAFSLRIVDFEAQFFHKKRRSSQVWQWRDLPKPITILCQRIATNGIASFCIDHRWRQMAFFVFVKMGTAPLWCALREIKQLLCEQS